MSKASIIPPRKDSQDWELIANENAQLARAKLEVMMVRDPDRWAEEDLTALLDVVKAMRRAARRLRAK